MGKSKSKKKNKRKAKIARLLNNTPSRKDLKKSEGNKPKTDWIPS